MVTVSIDVCEACGVEETKSQKLKTCAGCKLAQYCSAECQTSDRKSHKRICRMVADGRTVPPADEDTLILDDDDFRLKCDFGTILQYASKYMKHLKHVSIKIDQKGWAEDYYARSTTIPMMQGGDMSAFTSFINQSTEQTEDKIMQHINERVGLTANDLSSFLKTQKGNLHSFTWDTNADDHCLEHTEALTDNGQVWRKLKGLKILRMKCPVFGNANDLCKVIERQQDDLLYLSIHNMQLGPIDSTSERAPLSDPARWHLPLTSAWSRTDARALAQAVASCTKLVRLELQSNFLEDSDVEIMLSHLPNLRWLVLIGNIPPREIILDYEGDEEDNEHGIEKFVEEADSSDRLTDKTCEIIASTCPNLQALDIFYQRNITVSGIRRIFEGCQHLREFHSSAMMSSRDIKHFLSHAPNLFLFGIDKNFTGVTIDDIAKVYREVCSKTVVLSLGVHVRDVWGSLWEFEPDSSSTVWPLGGDDDAGYGRVGNLVLEAYEKLTEEYPGTINCWDELFDSASSDSGP